MIIITMKTKKIWVLAAILICGTMVLTSCKSNDDNAVPDTSALELWQAGSTVTAEAGFDWGGDWTTRKDYQHFEIVE